MKVRAVAVGLLLAGCGTVRGWLGLGGDEAGKTAEPVPAPPAPLAGKSSVAEPKTKTSGRAAAAAPDVPADAARREAQTADLKREVKQVEKDLRDGRIGTGEAKRRIKALEDRISAAVAEETKGPRGERIDALRDRVQELVRENAELRALVEKLRLEVDALKAR